MNVTAIYIHPIKALDATRVDAARVLSSGALELDRRWALTDQRGRFVNAKNHAAIHTIRAAYNLDSREVSLNSQTFSLDRQGPEIARWFSDLLHEAITWNEDTATGFPDDLDSPGPTFISTASLQQVATWFHFDLEETRRRFRTNIEFDAPEPFWEDRLYGSDFRVGDVTVHAVSPCQRCAVPSRDSLTGTHDPGFQKTFAQLREAHLPVRAHRAPFTHFYRFAVNARIAPTEAGKRIRTGDPVQFP